MDRTINNQEGSSRERLEFANRDCHNDNGPLVDALLRHIEEYYQIHNQRVDNLICSNKVKLGISDAR